MTDGGHQMKIGIVGLGTHAANLAMYLVQLGHEIPPSAPLTA